MNSTAALNSAPPVEADTASAPDAEAEHLRDLIEKQPCCLLRVGLDGLLLAANDAARQQLGGQEPRQVLDRLFTEWIIPEHHARWHEFVARIREAGSGSVECDLVGLESAHYPALLQGVLLADHPDGIVSVLLVARDISATRRLEEALQDHASTRQALADAQQQIERGLAERQGLLKAIEQREADNQRLLAERASLQALAEEHQLALMRKDQEGR